MAAASPEKIVYFVRHGQSEANVAPVFQGPESPLSQKGKEQAELIAERVAHLSFDALISSPVLRAKQTAEVIERVTGKRAEFSDLFTESIKPTGTHGKPYTDEAADKLWRTWEHSLVTPGKRAEDGENYDDMLARVDKALAWLRERPEATLVVVTHSFFLQVVVARTMLGTTLTPENLESIRSRVLITNTGLTVLRYKDAFEENPEWRLLVYNDHAHLG